METKPGQKQNRVRTIYSASLCAITLWIFAQRLFRAKKGRAGEMKPDQTEARTQGMGWRCSPDTLGAEARSKQRISRHYSRRFAGIHRLKEHRSTKPSKRIYFY